MQHIFVITYGRSGSTVLMNLLNAIDGYCIRGENLGAATAAAIACSKLNEACRDFAQYDQGETSPWYGLSEVQPDLWADKIGKTFMEEILRPMPDTRVVGFKEIRYTPYDISDEDFYVTIDFLAHHFANSKLIFNTRNWLEVVESGWWRYFSSRKAVRKIIEGSDERFRTAHQKLGSRSFLIDYSEYNGNPAGFRPLLNWLSEDLDEETIEQIASTRLRHLQKKHDDRSKWLRFKRSLF